MTTRRHRRSAGGGGTAGSAEARQRVQLDAERWLEELDAALELIGLGEERSRPTQRQMTRREYERAIWR